MATSAGRASLSGTPGPPIFKGLENNKTKRGLSFIVKAGLLSCLVAVWKYCKMAVAGERKEEWGLFLCSGEFCTSKLRLDFCLPPLRGKATPPPGAMTFFNLFAQNFSASFHAVVVEGSEEEAGFGNGRRQHENGLFARRKKQNNETTGNEKIFAFFLAVTLNITTGDFILLFPERTFLRPPTNQDIDVRLAS